MQEGWSEKYKKSIDCKNPKGFSQRAHCQGRKKKVNEDLRDWFGKSKSKDGKPGWVQADGSPCANEPEDKGKTPKCFSSQRLASLKAQGKSGEAKIRSAVRRKRAEDKGQQKKSGGAKPTMVRTFKDKEDYKKHPSGDKSESVQYEAKMEKDHEVSMAQSQLSNAEKDIKKLKKNLGKKEKNLPAWMQAKITDTEHNMDAASSYSEAKDPCWTGYKQVGMKKKGGKMVPNCVPSTKKEEVSPIVARVLDKHFATEELQKLEEENKPTNPKLWAQAKSKAKAKFDVYPSAYANGWAAKWYKSKGGGWKSVSEETVAEEHGKKKDCPKCQGEGCRHCDGKGYHQEKEEVSEAVRMPSQNGNVYLVGFTWRGKYMMMKLFFPEVKRPSRETVETALDGLYPGCRVMRYDVAPFQPGETYLNVGMEEETEIEEAAEDRLRDMRQERGGVDGNVDYSRPPKVPNTKKFGTGKTMAQKEMEKKYGKGATAMDVVKADIRAKHGKDAIKESEVSEGAAWTKKSGKNPEGGLNEKGRKSYERENPGSDLKAPSKKVGNKRRASFCARMKGMKKKLTSAKTASDPDSRINKSLRAWNC